MPDSVRRYRWQPTRLPRPCDFPGKNTGVGCHFLLQCMKGTSENEVAQSCLTLSDPMDCSPPSSSVHGIFQARVLEWGAMAFNIITENTLVPPHYLGPILFLLLWRWNNADSVLTSIIYFIPSCKLRCFRHFRREQCENTFVLQQDYTVSHNDMYCHAHNFESART